mmetsp:Transcript_8948/g.23291  ORF Transcript_8948/g.23291 Transcript_8948/m.23291 type:complete len:517 (+) Transcript_8948:24-1574(+)
MGEAISCVTLPLECDRTLSTRRSALEDCNGASQSDRERAQWKQSLQDGQDPGQQRGFPILQSWSALGFSQADLMQRGESRNGQDPFAAPPRPGVASLPRGPQRHAVPTYATSERTRLEGELSAGEVVQLRLGERVQKVWLSIYKDGFNVSPFSGGAYSHAWSPFTLIETCQVQVKRMDYAWAVFKLTILRRKDTDIFYYFGCSGENAQDDRDRWVRDISCAISRVTISLIPAHTIAVRPVPGVPGTVSRLMAGYLMRLVGADNVSLYYCELQAYSAGTAKLVLYQDEWCEHEVGSVQIFNSSVVSTRKGEYCTVFGVDSSLLCARTWEEKELWLRAVSNVKVKLMFDAPEPTAEELDVYRCAVLERVVQVEQQPSPKEDADDEDIGPLLELVRGKGPHPSPLGDVWHPDPMESPAATPRGMPPPQIDLNDRPVHLVQSAMPAPGRGDDDSLNGLHGPGILTMPEPPLGAEQGNDAARVPVLDDASIQVPQSAADEAGGSGNGGVAHDDDAMATSEM